MSAVDIGNMFDGLRDLVVCAIVAQQEQNSLLLKQQCEQCELIGSLQKRVQYLEEALSEMACQLQQVRAQIGEHDQVAQQDTATDAAEEWKTLRATVAKCLRAAWYGKAAEKEQQELPQEPVELNATLLTSRALEPRAWLV